MKKTSKKVGNYEVIAKIAQGGMGAVYKAKHPTLNRFVLLKRLTLRGGSQFIERFKREARIMMDIKHDHIVAVYDHFKEGSSYYIVEEFVDGMSLDQLIRRDRYLSSDAAALILYEVSKALWHAHEKGVVHRDMKPGNILISNQGEVKLVDFGIATSREESEEGLTRDGMTLGTPSYIPPEQIDSAKNVDRRADIYSLGVVLYEMLTGKTPFPGTFTAETIALIHKGRYTAPQRINPKIAPFLVRIVRKAMKPRRKRRFQDLRQIIRRLERRIRRRDPASIRQAVRRVIQGKEIRDIYSKGRTGVVVSLSVLLALLLGAGGYTLYRQGYYYELLQAGAYGSLLASARIPATYKDPKDIYISAVLYRESEGELATVDGAELRFRPLKAREGEDSYSVQSQKLYLPSGRYRLKVNLEGQLHWESFFLHPRTVQRKLFDTSAGRRIAIDLVRTPALPLEVRYSVRDVSSGADLSAAARLYVYLNNRWVLYAWPAAGTLTTGASYRFRVESEGYFPQTYNLLIKPYQPLLELEAELIPRPGTLIIDCNAAGLRLLLNEADTYLSGGRERDYRSLEPLTEGSRDLLLDPGEYQLTVRKSEALSRKVTVRVLPDVTVRVQVAYDKEANTLEVSVGEYR